MKERKTLNALSNVILVCRGSRLFGPNKELEINYCISLDGFLIEFSLILYNLFCDYDDYISKKFHIVRTGS